MDDVSSQPYEMTTVYLCNADELLSHLYDLATLNPHIAAIWGPSQ